MILEPEVDSSPVTSRLLYLLSEDATHVVI
jgi:hypothetical protein